MWNNPDDSSRAWPWRCCRGSPNSGANAASTGGWTCERDDNARMGGTYSGSGGGFSCRICRSENSEVAGCSMHDMAYRDYCWMCRLSMRCRGFGGLLSQKAQAVIVRVHDIVNPF